jgi:hypothetical protein
MTRQELREQINLMEALENVISAIDDVSSVKYEEGEEASVDIGVSDRSLRKAPIAFAHRVPHAVALVGLHAMQRALEQMLVKEFA